MRQENSFPSLGPGYALTDMEGVTYRRDAWAKRVIPIITTFSHKSHPKPIPAARLDLLGPPAAPGRPSPLQTLRHGLLEGR